MLVWLLHLLMVDALMNPSICKLSNFTALFTPYLILGKFWSIFEQKITGTFKQVCQSSLPKICLFYFGFSWFNILLIEIYWIFWFDSSYCSFLNIWVLNSFNIFGENFGALNMHWIYIMVCDGLPPGQRYLTLEKDYTS